MTGKENTESRVKGAVDGFTSGFGSAMSSGIYQLVRWSPLLILVYLVASTQLPQLPQPTLSDTQIVFIGVFIVSALVFYFPAAKLISRIWNPRKEVVAKIDAASRNVLNLWFASPEKVQNMEVEDGVPRTKNIRGVTTHLVNEFDPESNTAKAPREMEFTDWELWGEKQAIEQQRHRNNAFIQFGKELFMRLPAIGSKLENDYHRRMSESEVESTLMDPDSFIEAVENELPEEAQKKVMDEMRTSTGSSSSNKNKHASEASDGGKESEDNVLYGVKIPTGGGNE